jgi:hypothetical protein
VIFSQSAGIADQFALAIEICPQAIDGRRGGMELLDRKRWAVSLALEVKQ